ncbi:hypothetical protein IHZ75_004383 [Salmonella enterica]|nr:hypothetical protein [Salmonella enterica]
MKLIFSQPPEYLRDLLIYEDGYLYWTDEALKAKKHRKPFALGKYSKSDYPIVSHVNEQTGEMGKYAVHRLIYWWHTGEWPPMVDHIDRNRRNNKIENLRAATHSQNKRNSRSATNSTAPYIGVHWCVNSYRITISIEGKQYTKKGYKTPEAAALARDMLSHFFYGEFASYNFLDKGRLSLSNTAF